MTLEQLQTFMEVCHCKSIKKASENLYVSYQAVSQSIQKLEKEFNAALFNRSSNGVELTQAGQTLYNSAKNISNEVFALKQAMSKYQPKNVNKKICTIAIAAPLMYLYGQDLFHYLSNAFPDIYFNLSTSLYAIDLRYEQYDEYDISLFSFCNIDNFSDRIAIKSPYVFKQLTTARLFFWVSASSQWADYKYLDFDLLRNDTCCLLKQFFDKTMFSTLTQRFSKTPPNHPPLIVDLAENLVKNIDDFHYYTIDMRTELDKKMLCENLFKGHNILLKPSHYDTSLIIIYNKNTHQDLCNAISDFFYHLAT